MSERNEKINNKPVKKHPRFVRFALLAGIAIILNVFFFVVVQMIIPTPDYDSYCPQPVAQATTKISCASQNGIWNQYPQTRYGTPKVSPIEGVSGYCDYQTKCLPLYKTAINNQHLYAFVLMTVFGIIALVVGVVPIGASIVSSGLSYGGVIALIIGSIQYWGSAPSLLKLIISGIALCVLIYLGMRRFKDES